MKNYEVGVKYHRQMEDGEIRRVSERYLTNGVTFGHVEEKIFKVMETQPQKAEMIITSIKPSNYQVVLTDNELEESSYFNTVITNLVHDEDTGRIKKSRYKMLIQAPNIENVHDIVSNYMSDFTHDYEITQLTLSNIIDVIEDITESESVESEGETQEV